MRYSIEPKYRKYVEGHGFLSFARKVGDIYGNNLRDAATKTEIDSEKTASKRVVQKTAEVTRDLIVNNIAGKITSAGKAKFERKEDERNKRQEIYIQPEKRQQIINDLRS